MGRSLPFQLNVKCKVGASAPPIFLRPRQARTLHFYVTFIQELTLPCSVAAPCATRRPFVREKLGCFMLRLIRMNLKVHPYTLVCIQTALGRNHMVHTLWLSILCRERNQYRCVS